MNEKANKINAVGNAYNMLSMVYFELAAATQRGDKEEIKRLEGELKAFKGVLDGRLAAL